MTDKTRPRSVPDNSDGRTKAVRAGSVWSDLQEHAELLAVSSSYAFNSAEEAARTFSGEREGYVYSRYTNPSVRSFEQRLAALEGADCCVATSSGMSALLLLALAVLKPGDRVVSSAEVFGTTHAMLGSYLPQRLGIECEFVPLTQPQRWEKALASGARLALLETPSNPLLKQADLAEIAALCRSQGTELVVDNTLPTPVQLQPFALGADWVWHSATKWLDGQGRCVGGALLGRAEYESDLREAMRVCGLSMSPFNAWVFLKGMETLHLRVEQASRTARQLAVWLQQQPQVEAVFYPGLESDPQRELAAKQMDGCGSIVSFCVRGGQQQAWRCMDATQLFSITPNLGDSRSTLTHPATTTHRGLSDADKEAQGIGPNLVRLAVGLEAPSDLRADLQRGLSALEHQS